MPSHSTTTGLQALLDSWLGLWQLLFQPALGVLMLGAVGARCTASQPRTEPSLRALPGCPPSWQAACLAAQAPMQCSTTSTLAVDGSPESCGEAARFWGPSWPLGGGGGAPFLRPAVRWQLAMWSQSLGGLRLYRDPPKRPLDHANATQPM